MIKMRIGANASGFYSISIEVKHNGGWNGSGAVKVAFRVVFVFFLEENPQVAVAEIENT